MELANYGSGEPMKTVEWEIKTDNNDVLSKGVLDAGAVKRGEVKQIGTINVVLGKVDKATKAKLLLSLPGTAYRNEWDLWIYPEHPAVLFFDQVIETDNKAAWYGKKMELEVNPPQ